MFQDSLTAEDFQWTPGLAMVNKNNYTLTFSGHGSISSHAEHMGHHIVPASHHSKLRENKQFL